MSRGQVMQLSLRWTENCLINSITVIPAACEEKSLSTNGYWTNFPRAKWLSLYEYSQTPLDHEPLPSITYYLCFHLHCLQKDSGLNLPCLPIVLTQKKRTSEWEWGWHFMPFLAPNAHRVILKKKYCRMHCKDILSPGNLKKSPNTWDKDSRDLYTSAVYNHFSF